ncbi:MAG: hypothetical protein ACTSSD_19370 [Candidatus Thorarchaeota archaeon]
MVEGTSERPRRHRREVDDTSKKEVEEIEPPEKIASEVKELDDTIRDTDLRVRDAMTELKVRESREENISQGLEEAIGELREMESRKETTESKIKEALGELEDPVNDAEPELQAKVEDIQPSSAEEPIDVSENETNELEEETKRMLQEIENKHLSEFDDEELAKKALDDLSKINPQCRESREEIDVDRIESKETIEDSRIRKLYEIVHDGPPEVRIESMQDVDRLLEEHPEEKKRKRFDEQYRHSKVYFEVKDQHEVRREDLAKEHDVSHTYIGYWRNGDEPTQIQRLRRREEEQIIREWSESNPQISEKHLREFRESEKITPKEVDDDSTGVHRVNEQVVREATSHLKERDAISKEDIVKTTEKMNQPRLDDSVRIRYGNLQGELTPEKISELQRVLRENRRDIEEAVSKKLGLENSRARIAVVNDKIYTWVPKIRKDELVVAYEDQFYYFKDKREVVRIAEELQKRLGIEGNHRESQKQLNELARQMTVGDDGKHARKTPIDEKSSRLEGKVIRMYLDSTDKRLSELEGRVKKVTGINGQAGIDNPRFPEGRKLEVLKARMIAIIASDCYLGPSGRITYNEEHPERILRVQEILREFGDIPLEPSFRRGVYDVHIRNQIGLIVINEGMTSGDKTIQNPGLPESYKHWSEEARGAYLEELICEDGNFHPKTGFSW